MTTMTRMSVSNARLCFLVAILVLGAASPQGIAAQSLKIVYLDTPSNVTSHSNATFGFNVVDGNGTSPCGLRQNCTFGCKLDQSSLQDCVNRQASYSSLKDGAHVFQVFVNTSSGAFAASEFRWTIDTVPPTAVVDGGQAFTNGQNVTVNVTFTENCAGFSCTNASFCDLLVYGAGAVIPSSLKEIVRNRMYSVEVALSTDSSSGKVNAVIAPRACADAAGNLLQRSNLSSSVIRFDRTVPSVNLWTAVPSTEVAIDDQPRTCEATNRASELRVYLDFDSPVKSSAEDLLNYLSVSHGVLTTTARKSLGNRRFGFRLTNITDSFSEFTVTLAGNAISNRYGTLVPGSSSVTFLYDNERPKVLLSTTSRAKTKDSTVPFTVQFTEPVFGFNSSGVMLSGGTLMSFQEIDNSTFAFEVKAMEGKLLMVSVPENRTLDVAGNNNLASSSIQVRHYATPWISIVFYSLITVGLLSTALVSGALLVSSATLAAAGAISERKVGDPSRNLLGLVCHLQVVSLSGWLAVSLPVEYQEVTNGLRWLIPHINTPWQDKGVTGTGSRNFTTAPTLLKDAIRGRRRLLAAENRLDVFQHRGRQLGSNATLHGPTLGPGDYELYFVRRISELGAHAVNTNENDGWQDFQRNLFWMAVIGGSLILLHIILVLFLRWRTRAPIRGALIIPRFELGLLILAIPGLCQASAFIIRGGTPVGVIVGSCILAIPAAYLVITLIFLTYGVFLGALVQYKEFRYEVHRHGYIQPQKPQGFVNLVAGTGYPGKWVRNPRLAQTFLPRYGLIFEDHKGPPTILVHKRVETLRRSIRRASSTMENGDSDEESSDVVQVSDSHRILGDARAAYILVDLCRRIALGLLFGLYPGSDQSWSQVGIILGVSILQFGYLVIVKPFRRQGVQVVETISLLSEVGVFAAALGLLVKGRPTDLDYGVGIFMLALLSISFVTHLINEWYVLLERLLRLSRAPKPTLKDGLKKFAGGLVLPFIPRRTWPKVLGPLETPQVSCAASQPSRDSSKKASSHDKSQKILPFRGKPLALPIPGTAEPDSGKYHAEPVAQIVAIDVDSGPPMSTEEIQVEPSPRSGRQLSRTQWGRCISSVGEGRRSRDESTKELKMLRELAKASFSRSRTDSEFDVEQRVSSPVGHVRGSLGSLLQMNNSSPRATSDENRHRRRRKPRSDAESISQATSDTDSIFLQEDAVSSAAVPAIANLICPPVISPSDSDRSNVSKGLAGHVESSHSVSLRDTSGAIRPLEER